MNTWMTDDRKRIARQYVHDMIRSFVKEREQEGLLMTAVYAPDIERLLEIACCSDNYATKHRELNPFCTNDYYDIDGHCVHSLNGIVTIIFNGVSIQQKEYAEQMKLRVVKDNPEERRAREAARRQRHEVPRGAKDAGDCEAIPAERLGVVQVSTGVPEGPEDEPK